MWAVFCLVCWLFLGLILLFTAPDLALIGDDTSVEMVILPKSCYTVLPQTGEFALKPGGNIMTVALILAEKGTNVFSLSADTSVSDVLSVLAEKGIGAVLIANDDDTVAGILSERDIVRALARNGADILKDAASEHMTKNVVSCSENDAIASLMEKMSQGRFRHLPVLKDGKLAGLVSIGDVVKMRIEQAEKEAEDIRSYISAV